MKPSFWNGLNVVVTGGAGFVGSHLCEVLAFGGAKVRILDNFSRRGPTPRKELPEHIFDYKIGDASDWETCLDTFQKADVVFNLAATVAGVIYNQQNQLLMYDTNQRLQSVPVLAAERVGVPHFLQMSSVCIYATEHNHPAIEHMGHEGTPIIANEGYSWAKRMGEKVVIWANLPHAVIARPSNIYGPRDHFDERAHVIPALIKKVLDDDVIEVNGTGKEVREFIYVSDVAYSLMELVENGSPNQAYNVGTDGRSVVSIAELVSTIQDITGETKKQVVFSETYHAGDNKRWSDCSKAGAIGIDNNTELRRGLMETIEWYEENR